MTVKRLYGEKRNKVRLGPENGDHEELVLPAEGVRIAAGMALAGGGA